MKLLRCIFPLTVTLTAAFVAGCGGQGSPAAAPTGLSVVGEDGQITVNWTVVPGVQYRVYCAPGTSVDNSSWYTTFGGLSRTAASSLVLPPFTVDKVASDQAYACTVDGRYDNGPAGPAAASQAVQTRWAGPVWQPTLFAATSTGMGANLRAVTAGKLTGATTDKFFAVGVGGSVRVAEGFSSTWSDVSVPTNVRSAVGDLHTAQVFGGKLVVAGSTGTVAYTSDLVNWTTVSTGTAAIHNLQSNGSLLVAVGANGLIRTSADGAAWATPTVTTNPGKTLRGATYMLTATKWVAVGDDGAVLQSTTADASVWNPLASSGSTARLNAVAALRVQTPNTPTYADKLVAVGTQGAVGYSSDGQTWTWKSQAGGADLTQVQASNKTIYKLDQTVNTNGPYSYLGGQFMVAGALGKVLRSGDGFLWDNRSWTDISTAANAGTANAVHLMHYSQSTGTYSTGVSTANTWLLYSSDGAGRSAR